MKKMRRAAGKVLSLALAFAMLVTMQNVTVFAQTADTYMSVKESGQGGSDEIESVLPSALAEELRDRTFQTIDGGTQGMYSASHDLTFELLGSTTCAYSDAMLKELQSMDLPEDRVDIFSIDVYAGSKEDVRSHAETLKTPAVTYCYDPEVSVGKYGYTSQAMNDLISYTSYFLNEIPGSAVTEIGTPICILRDKAGRLLKVLSGWWKAAEIAQELETLGYADLLPDDQKSCVEAEFDVTYSQTEARQMLARINDFRTGDNAWEWDSTSTNKIVHTDLGELVYDYELEKAAMQRAAELVAAYDHTRPDGTACFTAYPSAFNNMAKGENIAVGTGSFPEEKAFTLWKEEEELYDGQGHRRNMLSSNFQAVGIAHVIYNGCHYWVQEFGGQAVSDKETTANDQKTTVKVSVSKDVITDRELKLEKQAIEVKAGESVEFPQADMAIRTEETWEHAPSLEFPVEAQWSAPFGGQYVTVSGGKVYGIKEGTTELTAAYGGVEAVLKVTVTAGTASGDEDAAVVLARAKADALEKLEAHFKELTGRNEYSQTDLNQMKMFTMADARTNISLATGTADVNKLLALYMSDLDSVVPGKTFDTIKQEAKEELAVYRSDEKESSGYADQWEKAVAAAQKTIDNAADRTAVSNALKGAKAKIDKMAAGITLPDDEPDLDQKRSDVFDEVEDYYKKLLSENEYEYADESGLADILAQAQYDIYNTAEDAQALAAIAADAKKAFDAVLTKAERQQQEEERKKKLQAAKEAAAAELNKYLEKVGGYSLSQQDELINAIEDGIWEINHAGSTGLVEQKLTEAKFTLDTKMGQFDSLKAALLKTEKTKAKKELEGYRSAKNYRTAQKKELEKAIKAGKAAIDAAKTKADIRKALAGAKTKIDKIKTDAQLKKEEAARKKVVPAKTSISGKLKAVKKGFTVKWKKQTKNVDGYEICYSTSRKFPKKGTVTKAVSKKTTTKWTIRNLKAKKKYYVRVRTYKKVKGKKYVSSWSSVKTVTTKK